MTSTNRDVRLVISETPILTHRISVKTVIHCMRQWKLVMKFSDQSDLSFRTLRTECIDMHVQWQCQQAPYGGGYTDLNIVYQNFKKDCFYFNLFGVMYEQYILSIINKLIVQAENSRFENIVYVDVDSEIMVATNSNSSLHHVKFNSTNNLPLKFSKKL